MVLLWIHFGISSEVPPERNFRCFYVKAILLMGLPKLLFGITKVG